MKHTREEIITILKKRDWTKQGSLWYANRGQFKHIGVSLREAASLEMLDSCEKLDAPLFSEGK